MNKLEQQMFEEFENFDRNSPFQIDYQDLAKLAATIALELAEKSYKKGWEHRVMLGGLSYGPVNEMFDQFKQEVL